MIFPAMLLPTSFCVAVLASIIVFVNPSRLPIDSLPVAFRYKIVSPVAKKIILAIRFPAIMIRSFLKKTHEPTFFRRSINFPTLPEKNTEITTRGNTIPATYIAPTASAPKKLGDKNVRVKMPISTGAQHALVTPENTPRRNIETRSVLFASRPGRTSMGNLISKNVMPATKSITTPPTV